MPAFRVGLLEMFKDVFQHVGLGGTTNGSGHPNAADDTLRVGGE